MANDKIVIRGAKEHNLKNIDLTIPRDKLIVLTGLSGSGKSSLAFDTIYADGQRRYMESLSSYARMFLGQMEKPNVESIEGLSPAISIDQKTTSNNPRSTVGTVTEIYDYLRLLYARIGVPHCPVCGREITQQTIDQIVDRVKELGEGTKIQILAPVARGRKGEYAKDLDNLRKQGFVRVRIDGEMHDLDEPIKLAKNIKHSIEVVVDRLVVKPDFETRLADSLETAGKLTDGLIYVDVIGGEELHFSQNYACPEHNISIDELVPRLFSFNNPYGACPNCTGLGTFHRVDPALVIPDEDKTIREGAIHASGWNSLDDGSVAMMYYRAISKHYGVSLDTPVKDLTPEQLGLFLYGTGGERIRVDVLDSFGGGYRNSDFEGVINNLERRYKTGSDSARAEIESYMHDCECPVCKGERLKKEALAVTVAGKNISEFCKMSISDAYDFVCDMELSERDKLIGKLIIKEIKNRLSFLRSVGLEYLTLSRAASSLSGGESQRIRLATQIGSSLMGVLYILDEPSIGLHQRDNDKLIGTLKNLRDLGNTVIVVEHDEDTMRAADYIVDIGPGAGVHGGEVVACGTADEIMKCKESITGQYLSGAKKIPVPKTRRVPDGRFLKVYGAAENNL